MIITAHKDWFAAFDHDNIDHLFGESRQDHFEQAAVAWLKDSFGDDVILARADLDETTYHIHAVVLPRSQTKDGRRMLQPSVHALIKDYEKAQDSVGEWFSELGLQRGERRKQALRDAVHQHRNDQTSSANENEGLASLPEHVEHVSPRKWREEKEWQLTEREAHVGKREKQAATVIQTAKAVTEGDPKTLAEMTQPNGKSFAARLFGRAFLHCAQKPARRHGRKPKLRCRRILKRSKRRMTRLSQRRHPFRTVQRKRSSKRVGHWWGASRHSSARSINGTNQGKTRIPRFKGVKLPSNFFLAKDQRTYVMSVDGGEKPPPAFTGSKCSQKIMLNKRDFS
ncbi:plasmid recombination protein [Ruegeria sp. AD91A]|uniref:plasmid recombination protein n=1 Tax=Ruegeria sp. AD91A TaxID=2293862 RepID=UPI0013C2E9D6|nr:plasmid recombination protein [Ruegeria sp. AD91A]